MKRIVGFLIVVSVVALGGCKKAKDVGAGSGSGSGSAVAVGSGSAAPDPTAKKCPPGNVLKGDACTPAVTAEKVAAIDAQKTRLDDLAKLLDRADDVAAPIELLDAIRQLDEYKKFAGTNPKFKAVEDMVAVLAIAAKQLHALQAGLKDGSIHLDNLKGELQGIMTNTGAAKKLEELQADVNKEIHATVDNLAKELAGSIQKVVTPIKGQLDDVSDLVIGACAMAKMSSSNEKLKDLCGKVKDVFTKAMKFLADFETRPQQLMVDLTNALQAQLGDLADAEVKKALDTAQQAVNDALKLPPAGSGSGSGSGSAEK